MKNELTDRQQEILSFIEQYKDSTGYPPTLREIGKKFGISSTFGVKRHLVALEKKGFLTVENNASRGISLTKSETLPDNIYRIPVIGKVAAGSPITAIENQDGNISLDRSYFRMQENSYALKVTGDSMIDAGILEGDIIIIQPELYPHNGDIVVAMLYDEVTVKVFEKKNDQIRLIPQNKKYEPIEIKSKDDFTILGRVISVIRLLN